MKLPFEKACEQVEAVDGEHDVLAVRGKFAHSIRVILEHTDELTEGFFGHNKAERSEVGDCLLAHGKAVSVHCDHIEHAVTRLEQESCQDGLILFRGCRKAGLLDHGAQDLLGDHGLGGGFHDRKIREVLRTHG